MPSKLQDYDILGEIGSGSYGTCKKVRRKSDQKVRFEIRYVKMKAWLFSSCLKVK